MNKLLEIVIGVTCELLIIKNPNEKYHPPEVTGSHQDRNGRTVLEIRAQNYMDAAQLTQGQTIAGNVHKSYVHVGHNRWETRAENNDGCAG